MTLTALPQPEGRGFTASRPRPAASLYLLARPRRRRQAPPSVRDARHQHRRVYLYPLFRRGTHVGRKRAMEMLLTGEPIDAPSALARGLVNRVVLSRPSSTRPPVGPRTASSRGVLR